MMVDVDELVDFLTQMELSTREEAPLFEIPKGSTDLATPPVTHGPWPAATCATVLRLWHDKGWIRLYLPEYPREWNLVRADWCARLVDGEDLAGPDAEALLDQPERWVLGHTDGHVAPFRTADGERTPSEQWHALVRDTVQRLPLRAPDTLV